MDIYSFINSNDIGQYCRKINHKFNPLEAAYLIWRSGRRTLKERHIAWKQLIDTTPDMAIPNTNYRSLHKFLSIYMEMENTILKEFYSADDNAVYFCGVYTDDGVYELKPQQNVFKTIDDCFEYIRELKNHINIIDFFVSKAPLNKQKDIESIPFRFDFETYRIVTCISKTDLFITFCRMCPVVPTPFKKGDIVKIYNSEYHKNIRIKKPTVFVIDTIGYWDIADNEAELKKSTNYNAILFSYDETEDNAISYTQIPYNTSAINEVEARGWKHNYLDLEYYHGELEGRERILTGISNYLKGNINLPFLMNTYSVMTAEMNFKEMIMPLGFYGWYDTPFKLGGWTDKDIIRFEKTAYDLAKETGNLIYEEDEENGNYRR